MRRDVGKEEGRRKKETGGREEEREGERQEATKLMPFWQLIAR